MLWTAMCIAAAALIGSGIERASAGRLGSSGQRTLLLAAVLVIAALGLSTSGVLVHWDVTSVYSEAVSFTLQNYADSEAGIIMLQFHESWLPQAYNLTDSGMVVYDFFGKHTAQPQKTKKIVIVDYNDRNHRQMNKMETSRGGDNATASLETDWIRRYSEIYNGGNRVAEFENAPKPDILIPSVVIPHVDRSVEVREWNPPGWASLSTYGPAGRALDLDDTAHITLATAPVLDLGVDDPFSIAFWIKNTGLGDPDSSIISKDDADMHQGITVWNRPGGGISLMMTDNAQDQIGTSTFSSVADGRWHHVVFTYDGSGSSGGLDVYVDGQIDRRGKHVMLLSEYAANEYLLKIDANSIGGGPAQDTVLDDVMIYSALLPASYVSAAHECHVEMAVLADEDTETAVEHTCMGDYDGALLVHLGFEDGLSDSLGVGGT